MEHQVRGDKVMVPRGELKEYLERRLGELSGMASNIVMALIMVTLLVIMNTLNVPYFYFFVLVLIPVLGRGYCQSWMEGWLRGFFRELLEIT
jgi:hypothetical protein